MHYDTNNKPEAGRFMFYYGYMASGPSGMGAMTASGGSCLLGTGTAFLSQDLIDKLYEELTRKNRRQMRIEVASLSVFLICLLCGISSSIAIFYIGYSTDLMAFLFFGSIVLGLIASLVAAMADPNFYSYPKTTDDLVARLAFKQVAKDYYRIHGNAYGLIAWGPDEVKQIFPSLKPDR